MSNIEILACEIYFNTYFMGYGYVERSVGYEWVHWQSGNGVKFEHIFIQIFAKIFQKSRKDIEKCAVADSSVS